MDRFKVVKSKDCDYSYGIVDIYDVNSPFSDLVTSEKRAINICKWLNENVKETKSFDTAINIMLSKLWKSNQIEVFETDNELVIIESEDSGITKKDVENELKEHDCDVSHHQTLVNGNNVFIIKENDRHGF